MSIDEIKKQIIMLRDTVLILCERDRMEIMDFLCECFGDFRLKSFTYEDDSVNEVLNLTKKEYFHLDNPYDFQDPYTTSRILPYAEPHNFTDVANSSGYQYGLSSENFNIEDDIPLNDWHCEATSEASNPVNLVLPDKEKITGSAKKSRRKQLFTRKSVRKLSDKSSQNVIEKGVQCMGCGVICRGNSLVEHLKSHEPVSLSCRVCRSSFPALFPFFRHKEEKKCKAKVDLICPQCSAKFKFISQYMKHLSGHNDNNCKHCSDKFSSRAQCRDHMKKCHPDVKIEKDLIPCKFCPMSFPRHRRLYNHYRLHHAKGKFVCINCGLFLPTKEKHKEHMLGHEDEKKWTCEICSRKFDSVNMLTNHMKIHNSGIYKCLTCKTTVASIVELKVHKRNKHEVSGLEPKFGCEICQKMFPKKSVLKRHMYTHSDKKEFSCKHCNKTFSYLDGLVKHQKLKSHFDKANMANLAESKYEKIFQDQLICETCGKQYKTYTQLIYHLRTHKGTYNCEICVMKFTMKSNLRRHMKSHESSRVASICELCGDSFTRVLALKDHMKIKHSDSRPVKCRVCGKAFKRNSALNRHMRIHDNVRPYVCFCGREYKQSAHLRSHQKATHGNTPVNELIEDLTPDGQRRLDVQSLTSLPPDMLDRDRAKNYAATADHSTLLGFDNFDDHDYRLHESFKVPYVGEDYGPPLGYGDLHFGAPPSVSPAVDLSMVAISDVVCRDMDTGLIKTEVKSDSLPHEPSSAIQLVNLSEHIVQEYLLNLP